MYERYDSSEIESSASNSLTMAAMNSSKGFSSEAECTFDLNFGQEDDDPMSSAGDLLSSTYAPTELLQPSGDFADQAAYVDRKNRKRKLDKEGFVTPATPDIPKSSLQYAMSGHDDFDESVGGQRENFTNVEGLDEDSNFTPRQGQQRKMHMYHKRRSEGISRESKVNIASNSAEQMYSTYESAADLFEEPGGGHGGDVLITEGPDDDPNFAPHPGQQRKKHGHHVQRSEGIRRESNVDNACAASPEPEPVYKTYESTEEMFEDLAQEAKMLIIQMGQTFRESEEYESMCVEGGVECLLEESKATLDTLQHQKDALQRRVCFLGESLYVEDE